MAGKYLIAVIGGHECSEQQDSLSERAGEIIAQEGAVLVTGGMGGIMEAASRGAKKHGGLTLGIIPGEDKTTANSFTDIVITTGMGNSRNTLVAGTADMLVAFSGNYGTLSEIAFALIGGKPVYGLSAWDVPGVEMLDSVEDLRDKIKTNMLGVE